MRISNRIGWLFIFLLTFSEQALCFVPKTPKTPQTTVVSRERDKPRTQIAVINYPRNTMGGCTQSSAVYNQMCKNNAPEYCQWVDGNYTPQSGQPCQLTCYYLNCDYPSDWESLSSDSSVDPLISSLEPL